MQVQRPSTKSRSINFQTWAHFGSRINTSNDMLYYHDYRLLSRFCLFNTLKALHYLDFATFSSGVFAFWLEYSSVLCESHGDKPWQAEPVVCLIWDLISSYFDISIMNYGMCSIYILFCSALVARNNWIIARVSKCSKSGKQGGSTRGSRSINR